MLPALRLDGWATALQDAQATDDGLLSLRRGEKVRILHLGDEASELERGWCYAEDLRSVRGWVKVALLRAEEDEAQPPFRVTAQQRVLSGYLELREGEELQVLYVGRAGDEEGWLYGTSLRSGASGWFPASHVTRLAQEEPLPPSPAQEDEGWQEVHPATSAPRAQWQEVHGAAGGSSWLEVQPAQTASTDPWQELHPVHTTPTPPAQWLDTHPAAGPAAPAPQQVQQMQLKEDPWEEVPPQQAQPKEDPWERVWPAAPAPQAVPQQEQQPKEVWPTAPAPQPGPQRDLWEEVPPSRRDQAAQRQPQPSPAARDPSPQRQPQPSPAARPVHSRDDSPRRQPRQGQHRSSQPAEEGAARRSSGGEKLPPMPSRPPPRLEESEAVQEAPEKPPAAEALQLLGDLARPGLRWDYKVRDPARRSYAGYLPKALPADRARHFFITLMDEMTRNGWDPTGHFSRGTQWLVQPGCSCFYRYSGVQIEPRAFPKWMPELMQEVMPLCGLSDPSTWPNSCNVNEYTDGAQGLDWHTDDEGLFQGLERDCRIISLSLGQERRFELRLSGRQTGGEDGPVLSLQLRDGDLCTMEGLFQRFYVHRVPKNGATRRRINLTWRWIVAHNRRCGFCR